MSHGLRTSMMRLSSQLIVMHAIQNSQAQLDAKEAQVLALRDIALDKAELPDNRPTVLVDARHSVNLAIFEKLRDVAKVIVVDDSNSSLWAKELAQDGFDNTMTLRVNPADFDQAVKSLELTRKCMSREDRRGGPAQWKQKQRNGR